MLSMSRLFALSLSMSVPWSCGLAIAQDQAQHSILVIESAGGAAAKTATPPAAISLISSGKSTVKPRSVEQREGEMVRDRYPNGKLRAERTVVLDAEGNYVNEGDYREYTERGDLLVTGTYHLGQREGVWARFLNTNDAKLLTGYPYNKFRAPLSSSVEYQHGKMHGVWVISDRDKRIAMQVELREGVRQGTMTLYHPNGQIYLQSQYDHGVLDGVYLEKNVDGKVVSEELYTAGQKIAVETEHYSNKHVKSVMRYLTSPTKATTQDDWTTTTLATYSAASGRLQHGEFLTYYDNGQVATKGTYDHGKLHGDFETWHRTGEVASVGQYDQGQQVGPWLWRHANGMKKAVATYVAGKPEGELRTWDESGKALVR